MENAEYIKKEIDKLYRQLRESAMTFIYKPHEIEEIKNNIFNLQKQCDHKFENGKCIYCRKEE